MDPRAEVYNAANPKQVRSAERRVRRRNARYLNALREVLSTPAGRMVYGEHERGHLSMCGINRSIYAGTPIELAYKAGRHDIGVELRGQLITADLKLFRKMEAEMLELALRDAGETDAAHVAAETQESED
jgi:hypothetical protein